MIYGAIPVSFFRTVSGGIHEELMGKVARIVWLGTMVILASTGCDESLLPDRVAVTPFEATLDALQCTNNAGNESTITRASRRGDSPTLSRESPRKRQDINISDMPV